jgi:integrase
MTTIATAPAGSIRQTPKGWVADVAQGGRRLTALRSTQKEAAAALAELRKRLITAATTPARAEAATKAPGPVSFTLNEARALSLRIRWRGTAYGRTAAIYSQAIVDWFGSSTQLAAVKAPLVETWRQELIRQGNQPATVNKKVSALKAMQSDAILHGFLADAPRLPKQLKLQNLKDRVIEDQERDRMCAYFQGVGQPVAADLLVFLLETGCRWGEAEKLTGGDVDLTAGRVTFSQTKTNRPRSVPLTKRAQDAIRPHLPAVRHHRVWPYSYNQYGHLFQRAKGAIGLAGDPAFGIHTCRHTCASRLASKGVSQGMLMAWGGWSSLAAVQRYMHIGTDALASCVAALEDS